MDSMKMQVLILFFITIGYASIAYDMAMIIYHRDASSCVWWSYLLQFICSIFWIWYSYKIRSLVFFIGNMIGLIMIVTVVYLAKVNELTFG